jgi:hypothetical protein
MLAAVVMLAGLALAPTALLVARRSDLIDRLNGQASDPETRDETVRAAIERAKQRRDGAAKSQ